MSLLTKFKGLFARAPSGNAFTWAPSYLTTAPRRGSYEMVRAYKENAWLHAVANVVASGVATPTWRAYKRVGQGGVVVRDYSLRNAPPSERQKSIKALRKASELIEVPDHEVLRILNEPSPEFTGRQTMKVMQLHLDLVGEAFMWLQRSQTGQVVGFIPLPPHAIRQTPTKERAYYDVTYNGVAQAIPAADIIWLKNLDPENPHARGAGLGLALGDELDTSEYIANTLKSTFRRGGMPTAVISVDQGQDALLSDVEDFRKRYEASFTGPENAGKPLIASGRVSLAAVNASFRELQMHELDKAIRDTIRQCLGVSPELIGDLAASNRSTSEEAKYILGDQVLLPRLEEWRTQLQQKLVPLIDPDVILDYEDPRPQNDERRTQLMTNATTAPAFLFNEVRELAGYDADPALAGKYVLPAPGAVAPAPEEPQQSAAPAQASAASLFRNT